jgi:hypothetical protein
MLRDPFIAVAEKVGHCKTPTVGIIIGWNDWEYPFWLLMRTRFGTGTQIEHVNVQNESCYCASSAEISQAPPEVIVIIGSSAPEKNLPPSYELAPEDARRGYRVFLSEPIRVFEKGSGAPIAQPN